MGGYWIYIAPQISEQLIQTRLENYSEPQIISLETEEIILAREIQNFEIRNEGVISFDLYWEERKEIETRTQTIPYTEDHTLNVKIIRRDDTLFFLIEKRKDISFNIMFGRLNTLLYRSYSIAKAFIPSDRIREILAIDADQIGMEHLVRVDERINWIGVSGDVSRRDEQGNINNSEVHTRYGGSPYKSVGFRSSTLNATVWIVHGDLRETTASVTGVGSELDPVERYIRRFVIPRISLDTL